MSRFSLSSFVSMVARRLGIVHAPYSVPPDTQPLNTDSSLAAQHPVLTSIRSAGYEEQIETDPYITVSPAVRAPRTRDEIYASLIETDPNITPLAPPFDEQASSESQQKA
jgi:hypothetical protein